MLSICIDMGYGYRIPMNLDQARTNIEDGIEAVERGNLEDANHFSDKAIGAMASVPDEFPYMTVYRSKARNNNFEEAFEALANFAAFVREYDDDDYNFDYSPSAIDRIEESYKDLE